MVSVSCEACLLGADYSVGHGMSGHGGVLVICEHCRRLVCKRVNASDAESTKPPYRCPYCRRITVEVDTSGRTPTPCPRCGSPLRIEQYGIWD
jgi:hypothetical protein